MGSFWKRLCGMERKDVDEGKGQYGVDYVRVSELMQFNRNLLEAQKQERIGIEFYTKFLEEARDEEGREMYRKMIEEERRHLKMVEDEIELHKKRGYWT
ncbi:MAG: hypothetical protein HZA60_01515 [Deltaproteobacteria bacterium]|nr:hypothetical protein [Deltaproteobacteria bacterium]